MNSLSDITIRPATLADAPEIHKFLIPFGERRQILVRSLDDICRYINNFLLAVLPGGAIVGTVALRDFDGALQEIRTLTVAPELHGKGLGTRLVLAATDLAKQRNAQRVFTLTTRTSLFLRLSFKVVDISVFPQKVRFDCRACPKREHCDETALLFEPSP